MWLASSTAPSSTTRCPCSGSSPVVSVSSTTSRSMGQGGSGVAQPARRPGARLELLGLRDDPPDAAGEQAPVMPGGDEVVGAAPLHRIGNLLGPDLRQP